MYGGDVYYNYVSIIYNIDKYCITPYWRKYGGDVFKQSDCETNPGLRGAALSVDVKSFEYSGNFWYSGKNICPEWFNTSMEHDHVYWHQTLGVFWTNERTPLFVWFQPLGKD